MPTGSSPAAGPGSGALSDLTVTVVSWNTRDLLRRCLRSLCSPVRCRVEIHVVDNASDDGSADMVASEFPEVRLIRNTSNVGFARANNQSWRVAGGRHWMVLNSDAAVRDGCLDALVAFMDAHPRAGLATARLLNPDGSPQHCAQPLPSFGRLLMETVRLHKLLPARLRGRAFLGPYWTYDEAIPVGWTWATALIARRAAVEETGPFCEAFFLYGEDLEWCLRMRRRDWEVWFCPLAEVVHGDGQSSPHWDADQRLARRLDGIYKALELHYGQAYVRALQAAMLLAHSVEWLAARSRGRRSQGFSSSVTYHRRALLRPIG